VKAFVTGGTGFIGGEVVRQLRARGDDVVCLVRSPEKGKTVEALGCELVAGDLGDVAAIGAGMEGCDAVIHAAAMYEVGIPASQRPAMREANVAGTENVLGAALEAKVPKVVYVSTVGIGSTHGKVVDESYEYPGGDFTSCYEQTKWEAHQVAKRLIGESLPCTIVQPGGVYGPGDNSSIGQLLNQFLVGKMPLIPFPDLGICLAHVEDTAAGIVLALDKGAAGEDLLPQRPGNDHPRDDRHRRPGDRSQGAEARDPDPADEGDDPDRAAGRQGDGPAAQPARADLGRRRRHLLGHEREGGPGARLRAARHRRGNSADAGSRRQAARRSRLVSPGCASSTSNTSAIGA
jgi:nucleoside-diphosphate-sugar epimerase